MYFFYYANEPTSTDPSNISPDSPLMIPVLASSLAKWSSQIPAVITSKQGS